MQSFRGSDRSVKRRKTGGEQMGLQVFLKGVQSDVFRLKTCRPALRVSAAAAAAAGNDVTTESLTPLRISFSSCRLPHRDNTFMSYAVFHRRSLDRTLLPLQYVSSVRIYSDCATLELHKMV